MKKTCAFLLCLLYFVTASAALLNFHYCMGRIAGVDVFAASAPGETCGKCGMAKTAAGGCCRDKYKILKLTDDRLPVAADLVPAKAVHYLRRPYPFFEARSLLLHAPVFHTAHSPPGAATSLFVLHCVFRV